MLPLPTPSFTIFVLLSLLTNRPYRRVGEFLSALASDFEARAHAVSAPALRELLEPWIQNASFDKERGLDLTIRQVPQMAVELPVMAGHPAVRGVRCSRCELPNQLDS
jgi:hypothetical protein